MSSWWQRVEARIAKARAIELRLEPLVGITPDAKEPHAYRCEGEEPTFRLVPPEGGPLPGGWVHLAGTCDRRGAELFATLVAIDDEGLEQRFPIPTTRAGRIDQVLRLPAGVRELRWIPLHGTGKVIQRAFDLTALGEAERRARMAGWAAHDLWKFRGTGACGAVGLSWTRLAHDLDGAYAASAKLRAHAPRVPYEEEIAHEEALANAEEAQRWRRLEHAGPTIAIALRCDGKGVADIRDALRTLDAQRYPRWRLHALATEHTPAEALELLRELSVQDARIVVPPPEATHGAALRRMLEGAEEDLVLIFDAGAETLSPAAFTFLASESLAYPRAAHFTSDEDVLDASGERRAPYRKPQWHRELFEAQLRNGSLAAFRTEAARRHAARLEGVDRADTFALVLEMAEEPGFEARVIPWTLAHRREGAHGAAQPEASEALELLRAMHARTDGAEVRPGLAEGTARVVYPIPTPAPKVTAIIPTRDAVEVLRTCVESIRAKTRYPNLELLIVDNQSRDREALGYLAELERTGAARVIRHDAPFNYSAINNRAVRESSGELLAFLNNDIEVLHEDWLEEMVGHALRPEVGAVGAKLLYPDGFVQHAGVILGVGGLANHAFRLCPPDYLGEGNRAVVAQQYAAVTGACMVMRRSVFEAVGGFDEVHLRVEFNDVDVCLKLGERRLAIVWSPHALLVHHESYSRRNARANRVARSRARSEAEYVTTQWERTIYFRSTRDNHTTANGERH